GGVRAWDSQSGRRVKSRFRSLALNTQLRDIAWHPHEHMVALAGYGEDAPVLIYYAESRSGHKEVTLVEEEKEREEKEAHDTEERRRLDNRRRLRELRVKR
ncbi:unnamed protein product, partial [Chrysoparadoxa australica]